MKLSQIIAGNVEKVRSQITTLMASIEAENRDATDAESEQLATWTAELDKQLARATAQQEIDERVESADTIVATMGGTGMTVRPGGQISVGKPVEAYPDGHGWLTDFAMASLGEKPSDRWEQHQAFLAATTTGDLGTGFVPPVTLSNRVVEIALGRRDLLRVVPKDTLTATGMEIYYPRFTQAPTAGVHAQGSDLPTRNPTGNRNTVPVVAIGGYVPLQILALRRGTVNESTVVRQIGQQIGVELNRQLMVGDSGGSSGEHDGLVTVAGVTVDGEAVDTLQKFRRRVVGAKNQVFAARDQVPTHLFVSPAYFGWMESISDKHGRAVLSSDDVIGPVNAPGSLSGWNRGRFAGLELLIDPNLTGEEDDSAVVVLLDETVLFGGESVEEFRTEHAKSATVDVSGLSTTAFGIDHTHAVAVIEDLPKVDFEEDPEDAEESP